MVKRSWWTALALLVLSAAAARAEVVEVSAQGFLTRSVVSVAAPPDRVYRALAAEVSRWWDPEHTYSGDSSNLSLDPRPGGCFCERLPEGGGVLHATVVYASPGKALRLQGALGPLQAAGATGSLTWTLTPKEGRTGIEIAYAVGGSITGGFEKLAPIVDSVLTNQLTRLGRFVDTGSPQPASPAR